MRTSMPMIVIKKSPFIDIREKNVTDKLMLLVAKISARSAELRLNMPRYTVTGENRDVININDVSKAVKVLEKLTLDSQISGDLDKLLK